VGKGWQRRAEAGRGGQGRAEVREIHLGQCVYHWWEEQPLAIGGKGISLPLVGRPLHCRLVRGTYHCHWWEGHAIAIWWAGHPIGIYFV